MSRSAVDEVSLPGQVLAAVAADDKRSGLKNSQPEQSNVHLVLLDVDGCLYPNDFPDFNSKILKEINKKLFDLLIREFEKQQYDHIIFGLGTARQDERLDAHNIKKNNSCSCAFILPCFQKHFQQKTSKPVSIDPIMMGDVFATPHKNNVPELVKSGSAYAITLSKDEKKRDIFKTKADRSKISLLYMHAHRVAALNANSNITISFFDDNDDILKTLHQFFNKHPDLLPINVELQLYKHVCAFSPKDHKTPETPVFPETDVATHLPNPKKNINYALSLIKGSGLCDRTYDRTVQFMSYVVRSVDGEKTAFENPMSGSTEQIYKDFLKYLDEGCQFYITPDNSVGKRIWHMCSQSLFGDADDETKKALFLKVREQIGLQLQSRLLDNNYPDHSALLEMYKEMGGSDMSLEKFTSNVLKVSKNDDKPLDLPNPYLAAETVVMPGHADDLIAGAEGENVDHNNRSQSLDVIESVTTFVVLATGAPASNSLNFNETPDVARGAAGREAFESTNAVPSDAPATRAAPEVLLEAGTAVPAIPFVTENNNRDVVSQHAHAKQPEKKPGFFSCFFGRSCCGENSCLVRENRVPGATSQYG